MATGTGRRGTPGVCWGCSGTDGSVTWDVRRDEYGTAYAVECHTPANAPASISRGNFHRGCAEEDAYRYNSRP